MTLEEILLYIAVSIMGNSEFAEYNIIGDSFIEDSIIGYSEFAKKAL
jgi:hypothetical protein